MPAGFVWVSRVADQRKTLSREALARQSSSDSQTSCSSGSSCSFDDARPAPGSTLTSAAPRAAPRAASRAPPPYAPPAAPPPLPAGLAHSLDELIGLDDALAAPPAPSVAEPNVSSSSWLEQQELAEVLEDHLTGVEAVEVSKTHRVSKRITHATPRSQAKARYDLLTYLLTSTVYSHYLLHTLKRWRSRTRCSRWTPARHLWNPLQSRRRWKTRSSAFSRISKRDRCSRGGSSCGSSCGSWCHAKRHTNPHPWYYTELTVTVKNEEILLFWQETSWSSSSAYGFIIYSI